MLSDLRFAARQLAKSPGFTTIAIVALALGVATATTVFTFYNALVVRPIPFLADESTLVTIRSYDVRDPQEDYGSSVPDFNDLRRSSSTLASALTTIDRTYILGLEEPPSRALGSSITVDAFQTLGVNPIKGRLFRPEESAPGAPQVALISYSLWKRAYGGAGDIVGQVVTLNSAPVTIIGVMPEGFGFPKNSELWQPFADDYMSDEASRDSHGWPIYARLRPGVTLNQAQAELETVALRLEKEYPRTNTGLRFRVQMFRDQAVRDEKLALQLMMGAVVAVLLIACGNVANLLLARATARSREIAIRAALGAGRGRLIVQMLTESLLLGLCGGLAGLLLTFWEIDLVLRFIPVEIPFWVTFDLDWRVLSFALAATVGSSLLFGLFPALQISRPDLSHELKDGGRCNTVSSHAQRFRAYLVVAQLAITLVLLVAAGLLTRSFLHLQSTDLGIDPNGVFTFRTGIPPTMEKEQVALKFFETAEQRLKEIPGVEHAGFISYLPANNDLNSFGFAIEGRPEPKPGEHLNALYRGATPGVFPTLRIPLIRGRLFDERDREDTPRVGVVSQAFVKKFFPGEDPLGHRIVVPNHKKEGAKEYYTIIGIVGDVRQRPTGRESEPSVWCPLAQKPDNFLNGVMRVQGDPTSYERAAQDAITAARANTPIYKKIPLTRVVSDAMWSQRFFGGLFASFAGIALFLASLGIYGVMAYSVAQRTQEIGVRMALGAEPAAVILMVLKQGLLLIVVGLVLGFIGAWFIAQLLSSLLHGVEPHDPPTFACVPALLALVALVACWLPSRRATRIDPNAALRAD
jgi:putative ABC transport system permease protein